MTVPEVVITGVGVVSPIGIGREAFWDSLLGGRSGVGPITQFDPSGLPVRIAGEVDDFVAKDYVANRKQLKLMSRDAQLGIGAANLACRDAGVESGAVDPERFGVVLGGDRICNDIDVSEGTYRVCLVDGQFVFSRWAVEGMEATFPLNFLKVLPNMTASHVSIAHDARGPNNTIHLSDLSGLSAIIEAATVIQRGWADIVLAGGASSQLNPFDCSQRCVRGILSDRHDDPTAAMRPFDADRDGQVWGEGGAILVLERREHAEARGAKVLGRLLGWATTCENPRRNGAVLQGKGLGRAIEMSLERAGVRADQLGHVNAHGLSTVEDDRLEARVLSQAVPGVAVTAPKSYFGNLGSAAGAMETAASVLALEAGMVPATLNYRTPDPECPIDVVRGEPAVSSQPRALKVGWTQIGQAAAVVLGNAR